MRNYDEYPIQVKSRITLDGIKRMLKEVGRPFRFINWLLLLYLVIMLFVFITLYNIGGYIPSEAFPGSMMLIIVFLVFIISLLSKKFAAKKIYRNISAFSENGFDLYFYNGNFIISNISEGYEAYTKAAYYKIHQVIETSDSFYISFIQNQIYIIEKTGIENVTPEELSYLLRCVVEPSKYKYRVKN